MVEMNLTLLGDQEIIFIDLSFVKVMFILNRDMCFISGILLARVCNLMLFRLEMFRDCIKLKFSILE